MLSAASSGIMGVSVAVVELKRGVHCLLWAAVSCRLVDMCPLVWACLQNPGIGVLQLMDGAACWWPAMLLCTGRAAQANVLQSLQTQ
jgi:hypothetical protein